jgi:hypothetical protein
MGAIIAFGGVGDNGESYPILPERSYEEIIQR